MTWHLLLGVAGLVSAATAQQTIGIETYIPPASGVTPQASIRYSTSTLIFTTTITTNTRTFTFSSTSTVTETYQGDAFYYTSTIDIPASTETVPTTTLETAVSEVSGGQTIISTFPTTDFSTKLEGHVVTSLDSTIPYDTLYSSVLVSQASEVVSTEQIIHTSVEYTAVPVPVPVPVPADGAEPVAPVTPVTSKTTITKEYDTTILSLPYTTQTYTPSPAYGNGTAIVTGTVIVWQSCYIVTRATTTTTLELDVVTPDSTPTSAPTGVSSSVSSSALTTHTSTEFVPHTFTTINTYYVTTPVETDYTESTSLSTSTVTSIETDEYVYETIVISGGSTFLTTVPVDTLYTQIYISAHESVVSGIEEETLTTTYTQGNPVSYLVSSYVFTTTETYRYDIPETTIASDARESGDSGDSSSFTLLSFNSESSRQQNAPSIITIILTIACVVMIPLIL